MADDDDADPGQGSGDGGGGTAGDDGKAKAGAGEGGSKLTLDNALDALKATRREAAQHRVDAKALRDELATLKDGLASALGMGKDEKDGDVSALTKKVDALMAKLGSTERREAFRVVAQKLGADPDLSYAYLTSNGALDSPDTDVEAALKAAMKSKPQLRAGEPARTGDPGGGSGKGKTGGMNSFIRRAANR